MRNYDNKLFAVRSVTNGMIPFNDEGPRALPLTLDFSTDAQIYVDLEKVQASGQQGLIGQIQAIHVDNTRNAFDLEIEVLVTRQRILIPALTEAVRQIFCSMPAQIIFTSTISSADVRAELLNVPLAPYTYGPLAVNASVNAVTGTFDDFSGTIAAGGVSQALMPANALRKGLVIQNPSSEIESLYVNFTSAATIGQPSYELTPGSSWQPLSFVSTEAITIIAATTGHTFTAKELL